MTSSLLVKTMAGAIQLAQRAEKLMVRLTDTQLYTVDAKCGTQMAAAQNVRSGSSPGPTNDPDL